jgi:hypothetical protein
MTQNVKLEDWSRVLLRVFSTILDGDMHRGPKWGKNGWLAQDIEPIEGSVSQFEKTVIPRRRRRDLEPGEPQDRGRDPW